MRTSVSRRHLGFLFFLMENRTTFIHTAQNGTFEVAPLFRWAETTEALCQELDNLLARHRLTDYASIIFSTINLIMIFTEHPRLTFFFFLVCIPVICAEHFKILTLQDT